MTVAQQVRRPLVGIALSVTAGLGLQRWGGGSPLLLLGAAALLLAFAGWNLSKTRTAPLMYAACVLLAAAYGSMEAMPSASRAALRVAEVSSPEQELTGAVADDPVVSDEDGRVSFLFRTEAVLYGEAHQISDAMIQVYLENPESGVRYGEQWRLRGRYTGYEKPRDVCGFFSVAAGGADRLHEAPASFLNSCYKARRRAAEILRSGIEAFPVQVQLLHALLLGYRKAIPPELYQVFCQTGIMHIFAISGLHVGVMAAILIAGLKLTGMSRPRWGWVLIPCLFLYVMSTGMKPSAMRAFTMAAVYFAAPLAGRRPDAPSSVALACLLLLAIHPAYVSDPGFLLSFVVVCGILMVHNWTGRQIKGLRFAGWSAPLRHLNGPNPFAALLRATGLLLLTSTAAWIFSIPVSTRFFNILSPVSLLGNLAVIPLTFMIMLTGCLTLLTGFLFFPTAALFNQANLLFINLLVWIVRHLDGLPGAHWTVLPPSLWGTGLWYTGWVVLFCGPARWKKSAVLVLLLSVSMWLAEQRTPCSGIKILRAQNSSLAVRFPGAGWTLVTDGRPRSTQAAIRLLRKEGIGRLETLMITGTRAEAASVQQLQKIFMPQETRIADENARMEWCFPAGAVRISADR